MSTRDDAQSKPARAPLGLGLLPLALGLCASLPALFNGALFDDELLIFSNPFAQSLRYLPENLSRDFFFSAAGQAIGYYRPASKLLFMLEYQLFGAAPLGYHALSLAGFVLVIALALRLTRQLGLSPRAAALALCLFATHPAAARTVATIASQSDLLCAATVLACLSAYLRFRRDTKRSWLRLALLWESLALAFKETAVILPLLLWAQHWSDQSSSSSIRERERERERPPTLAHWRITRPLLLSLLPVLAYLGLRLALGVLPIELPDPAPADALAAAAKLTTIGLLRALLPLAFNPALHTDRPDGALLWSAAALALLAASAFAFVRVERLRQALALIWLPTLLVVAGAGAIHITEDRRALVLSDRWLLIPALGAAWLAGQLIDLALERLERPPLRAAVIVGLAGLVALQSLVAAEENASYRTENARVLHLAALYRQSADPPHDAPEILLAADAIEAERKADVRAALKAHAALLALKPADSVRRYNLAHALFQAGELRSALAEAHLAFHARALDGSQPYPENDSTSRRRAEKALLLGLILERLDERVAAARYFEIALELNPDVALAQAHLQQLRASTR